MRNLRAERSRQLRSGQLLGALLTSLAIGAAATAAAIENWGRSIGLVVGGSALAVVAIVTTLVQQRMVQRRVEARLLRAHVRVLDRGRLPQVGATRHAPAIGRLARPSMDAQLAEALRRRWFVVVEGDHAAQVAADAMRAVWPYRRLLVPMDGHSLAMLLTELDLSGTVVWLGDLDEFIRNDGAATSVIDRLATVPDLTVVATRLDSRSGVPPEVAEVLRRATVITATEPELPRAAEPVFSPVRPAQPDRGRVIRAGVGLAVLMMTGAGLAADAAPGAPACGFPAELRVVTSVELTPILRDLVVQFRHEVNEGGCQRANVQVQATTSAGATIEALARGWSRQDHRDLTFAPDLLIPDSTVDVERVRLALERSKSEDVTLVSGGSIALSPIALAAPRSTLKKLAAAGIINQAHGTDPTFRWHDLVAPTGDVTIARANPRSSSVGFAATVVLYRAALAVEPGVALDRQRMTAPGAVSKLRGIERGVAANYEETSGLLCALRIASAGGRTLTSTSSADTLMIPLVAEHSIVDYNDGRPLGAECAASTTAATDPLVSLIATEGTPVLDYPVVRVDWGKLPRSRHRQAMAERFVAFLHEDTAQAWLRGRGFRDQNLAQDHPQLPADRPGRVALPSGPQVNDVLAAWEQARRPARMLLAVDVSRAMGTPSRGSAGNQLDAAVTAIKNSLRLIGDRDQIGLWASAEGIGPQGYRELVPIGRSGADVGSEPRVQALTGHLNKLQAGPTASTIPSILPAAVDRLRSGDPAAPEAETDVSTALVLFTAAGAGTGGINLARPLSGRVPMFFIVFGADGCTSAVSPSVREAIVDSGGACFTVESLSDVGRAMDGLAAALWSGQS